MSNAPSLHKAYTEFESESDGFRGNVQSGENDGLGGCGQYGESDGFGGNVQSGENKGLELPD